MDETVIFKLSDDLLAQIFAFQTVREYLLFTTCSKHFSNLEHILKRHWAKLLINKWELPSSQCDEFSSEAMSVSDVKYLYRIAEPLLYGLTSDDLAGLTFSGNRACFDGVVGEGNRSVSSKKPFAPSITNANLSCLALVSAVASVLLHNLLNLKRLKFGSISIYKRNQARTFSTPFRDQCYSKLFVSSRRVAYYEVQIRRFEAKDQGGGGFPFDHLGNDSGVECVAVGLASNRFVRHKRMPGWDSESYGYHSDDGAIFHGQGRQLSLYGPAFGCNDVVGCGMDYGKKCIFFTLNGKHLGTAFDDIITGDALFPTVGIDAAVSVYFNFGLSPFMFNLSEYIDFSH